ncbi:MAG: hypothetical protein NZP74_03590 [Anaerolineales bacterium]|nr:hypothetical protein [Anaerolineales bacterium]MDW8277162.1 hypothetical protein [Anaerolineales bacterium]
MLLRSFSCSPTLLRAVVLFSTCLVMSACGVFQVGLEPAAPEATLTLPPTVPVVFPTFTPTPIPPADFDPLPAGKKIRLTSIHMLDKTTGWGIGQIEGSDTDFVLLTRDGGRTWQNRTPRAVLQSLPPQGLALTAFFGPQGRAWALWSDREAGGFPDSGVVVWRTADFGQTWQTGAPLSLEGVPAEYFVPVHFGFLDATYGWLMARLGAGMSHDYVAAFVTEDGGLTWRRVLDPVQHLDLMVCQKTGLAFVSAREGWLTGDCPGLLPGLFLYATRDGGQTWQAVSLPVPAGLPADWFGGEKAGCGVTGLVYTGGDGLALSVRCLANDGGKVWGWLYTAGPGKELQARVLPQPYGGFQFLNAREGWFIGAASSDPAAPAVIYRTTDGGLSWRPVLATAWQGVPNFVDAETGWVIARTGEKSALVYTTNGGLLWEEISPVTGMEK